MQQEADSILSTPAGDSEDAQQLRQLENRLDKAIIKNNEASHIRKTYEVILQKLQEVRESHAIVATAGLMETAIQRMKSSHYCLMSKQNMTDVFFALCDG